MSRLELVLSLTRAACQARHEGRLDEAARLDRALLPLLSLDDGDDDGAATAAPARPRGPAGTRIGLGALR